MHRPNPAWFTFYIHEHALSRVVGTRAIMHEQLLALTLLDGLPQASIRVVPESSMFGGAFCLFQFAKHDPLVNLDVHVGAMFLDDREYVEPFGDLAAAIADAALNEGQSREYLATLAYEYDRGSLSDPVEEEQL